LVEETTPLPNEAKFFEAEIDASSILHTIFGNKIQRSTKLTPLMLAVMNSSLPTVKAILTHLKGIAHWSLFEIN
jgi:hypothetical protein